MPIILQKDDLKALAYLRVKFSGVYSFKFKNSTKRPFCHIPLFEDVQSG